MEEDIINNMATEAKSVEELLSHYPQGAKKSRSVARDVARRYLIIRAERDALKAKLAEARVALIAITEIRPEQDNDTLQAIRCLGKMVEIARAALTPPEQEA